jgi:hypothetical protein
VAMKIKHTVRMWIGPLALLANVAARGQVAAKPRTITPAAAAATLAPTVTILSAASGALVRSLGAGNASLDLGPVSYFKGTAAAGESRQKNPGAFVITTRFMLRVDCPGSSSSSQVIVSMSRMDSAASHAIAVDGTTVVSAPQTLEQSMACGSSGEHRMDVEVPISTPAGVIGSTVAFLATLKK